MAKRLTDTGKWNKPLLRSMKAPYKLLFLYLLDECDHAGIWQVDIDVAQLKIGEKIRLEEALKVLGHKIMVIDGGQKWFIPDFVDFQYGNLNPKNKVHNSIINILLKYNLLTEEYKIKGLASPIDYPLQGAMDKDKEKEKDKEEGDSKGEIQVPLFYRQFKHLKLTHGEFDKLIDSGYSKNQIDKILDKIENYKKNNNYSSLYLTAIDWLGRNEKQTEAYLQPEDKEYT